MIQKQKGKQTKTLPQDNPDYKPGDAFKQLSEKQKAFVAEYFAQFQNGAKTYLKLYPKSTTDSAKAGASELLALPYVRQAVLDECRKRIKAFTGEESINETFAQIKAISSSDISDVINMEDGTFVVKSLKDIPVEARKAIKNIKRKYKETKDGIEEYIEVTLHDKMKAIEFQANIQKLLNNKVTIEPIEIIIKPAIRPEKKEGEEKDEKN